METNELKKTKIRNSIKNRRRDLENYQYKNITMYTLCLLLILNLLDALLTVYGLSAGVFREANPIVRQTLEEPIVFYLIKVAVVTLSICFSMYSIHKAEEIKYNTMKGIAYVVIILTTGYSLIVAWAAYLLILPWLMSLSINDKLLIPTLFLAGIAVYLDILNFKMKWSKQ